MSTAVFLSFPARGHINPTLPVIAELVRRGERIVYYALEECRGPIERTGAEFHPYPASCPMHTREGNPVKLAQDPNPYTMMGHLLETSRWALDHFAAEVRSHRPGYLAYDMLCPWGPLLAQV